MSSMFYKSRVTSLDLSSFDTSSVTNMGSGVPNFNEDGSSSGGNNTGGMFEGVNLENLTVGDKFTIFVKESLTHDNGEG